MRLDDIKSKTADGWECLPGWARFFVSLGGYVSGLPIDGERVVVGVAAPTRGFAAAFAAAGAVCGYGVGRAEEERQADHFEELCRLPKFTAVTYLQENRNKLGVLSECTEHKGHRWLKVQTGHPHRNSETHWVNREKAHRVQVVPGLGVVDPRDLPYNQYGTLLTPPTEFTRRVLGEGPSQNFAVCSRMRTLIVGRLSHLRREAVENHFAAGAEADAGPCTGTLQEIVRARRLFGTGSKPYRADVFPSNSRRAPRPSREMPPLVIFDGCHGFLRWRQHWRGAHWLVILDVTEGNFGDAREAINEEYVTRRSGDDVPADLPTPPGGVELVFYRETLNG